MDVNKLYGELDNLRRELEYYEIYEPGNNSAILDIDNRMREIRDEINDFMEKKVTIICTNSCDSIVGTVGNIQLEKPTKIEKGKTFTIYNSDYIYGTRVDGFGYVRIYIDGKWILADRSNFMILDEYRDSTIGELLT